MILNFDLGKKYRVFKFFPEIVSTFRLRQARSSSKKTCYNVKIYLPAFDDIAELVSTSHVVDQKIHTKIFILLINVIVQKKGNLIHLDENRSIMGISFKFANAIDPNTLSDFRGDLKSGFLDWN